LNVNENKSTQIGIFDGNFNIIGVSITYFC